jgi:DNA-binding MarR family transcriptional regulator
MTEADTLALAQALRPVLLRLSRQLRRQAEPVGLSAIDVTLLSLILNRPGLGVSELAEREQMSRPAMSDHIKRLEAAGYISRAEPDPQDRRRVGLLVTDAGQTAIEAVRRRRDDWLSRRLADLTPDARAALLAAIAPLAEIAGDKS